MQRRIVRVQHHHRAHEAFHDVAQVGARRRQRLRRRPHQERLGGRHVFFEQRDEERVLAREVLVERADRHTGERGDVVRRGPGIATGREDPSSRIQDGADRVVRPPLQRHPAPVQPAGAQSRCHAGGSE
jgi:hypothetical protein